jgi:hypothetical protein
MSKPQRSIAFTAIGLGMLSVAGCAVQSASDAGVRFHYSLWVPAITLLIGFACIPIGLLFIRSDRRLAWGSMIIGPLAAIVMAPTFGLERVWVDDQGFTSNSGIFGMTSVSSVKFDTVNSMRITQEETGGRRSRLIEVLYFDTKGGESIRFPLNNDVKIESAKEIIVRAQKRGVTLPRIP